jgi:SNF2 family DNA or RNA helicase
MELVLFCKLTPLQVALYRLLLRSKTAKLLAAGEDSYALECMQLTLKLCNHPALVYQRFVVCSRCCVSNFIDRCYSIGTNLMFHHRRATLIWHRHARLSLRKDSIKTLLVPSIVVCNISQCVVVGPKQSHQHLARCVSLW